MHTISCAADGIPFGALVSIIYRGKAVFLNDRLRPLGLTSGQFPVLLLLAKEQNITQETLVRHYRLDRGTIARAVSKLESTGYIRKIVDPGNRRAVRLFLTEKGRQAIPVLHAINRDWEVAVFRGIPRQDKDTIRGLMQTIASNNDDLMKELGGAASADE